MPFSRSKISKWGALLLALCVGWCGPAAAQTVSYNVTIRGLAVGAGLSLGAGWTATLVSDALVVEGGVCPAGRWCPAGASAPSVCAAGTYSAATGQTTEAAACGAPCPANSYCPDPGAQYPCPLHTVSAPGSPSQLGCKCASGYSCLYFGNMQVTLQLPVSVSTWLGDPVLRGKAQAAVAAAAGVPASAVSVADVRPVVPAARRLLSLAGNAPPQRAGVSVQLLVRGAESFERLDAHLAAAHPALRGARAEWRHGSRVRVLHRSRDRRGADSI